MPNFSDILLEARRASLRDFGDLEFRFYRLYLLALNRVLQRYPGAETEEIARELLLELQRQQVLYGRASEILTKRTIRDILETTVEAHKDALRQLTAGQIEASFDGVSRDAFEDLFKRRNMGLTSSYKSLSLAQIQQAGRVIENALQSMVLDGDSWQDATQRIIDGLVLGDGELARMAKSMARRSRGLGTWLERTNQGLASMEAVKRARKIAYDARRIARTEVAHAHHEADRQASLRSPVVKGLKWNLSPRHPEPDICDVYAKVDLHGLGPGVYPPEYLPPLPHPHCLCFMTHVLYDPGEWQNEQPAPSRPRKLSRGDVLKHMKGTDNAIKRTLEQINSTSKRMVNA